MTNQLIKKINLNHSFIFFLLINLFSVVMFKFNYLDISSTICLFLILTIGVSHGALDNIKGKKLLKIFNFEGIYIFYIIYIFIALSVIFIWLLFPAATLLIFLSVKLTFICSILPTQHATQHYAKLPMISNIFYFTIYQFYIIKIIQKGIYSYMSNGDIYKFK